MTDPSQNAEVVFVSYDEPEADENYRRLLTFRPQARRLHGVEGIYNAYQAAADLAAAPYFFMIDGDNWVIDDFVLPPLDMRYDAYVWRARNAVNGLQGFGGGIKLISTAAIRTMDHTAVDFFVSMGGRRIGVYQVATETRFNATPFLAWRAAFRECAKLASAVGGHNRAAEQLEVWQTLGGRKQNGIACILGARMGAAFGVRHAGTETMKRINDKAFLAETFAQLSRIEGVLDVTGPPPG